VSAKIPVLVTGVGGAAIGEQILKALRRAETPYVVIGTDVTPQSAGLAAVDKAYLVPPARDPDYLDVILRLCRKHAVKAIFPGTEAELKVFSANADRVRSEGLFLPINPASVIDLCLDKVRTSEFLSAQGFPVPAFRRVTREEEAADFGPLPVVLKPSRGGGGSTDVILAQEPDMVLAGARHLLRVHGEFIIQAYVGDPEHEFTVGVLHDMNGELLHSIAVRRQLLSALGSRMKAPNRTTRDDLGRTLAISSGISQGEIGPFPEVTRPCEAIARKLGSRGPLNLQCRLVGDRVFTFEINPRFSGTTSLRAMVGFNEPDLLVRKHVLGEPTPARFAYRTGVILRGLSETLLPQAPVERAE
jgi:carbamoyl-phosphate synthase large subunit